MGEKSYKSYSLSTYGGTVGITQARGNPGGKEITMDKIELKPCPVCGRMPKVRYRAFGVCGAWVKVRCKPLFRREHLAVWYGAATMELAFDMAVEDWNRGADNG